MSLHPSAGLLSPPPESGVLAPRSPARRRRPWPRRGRPTACAPSTTGPRCTAPSGRGPTARSRAAAPTTGSAPRTSTALEPHAPPSPLVIGLPGSAPGRLRATRAPATRCASTRSTRLWYALRGRTSRRFVIARRMQMSPSATLGFSSRASKPPSTSSPSIPSPPIRSPVHLLTLEALRIYQRVLAPEGVLAVHISNRHLDLEPVLGGAGRARRNRCPYQALRRPERLAAAPAVDLVPRGGPHARRGPRCGRSISIAGWVPLGSPGRVRYGRTTTRASCPSSLVVARVGRSRVRGGPSSSPR